MVQEEVVSIGETVAVAREVRECDSGVEPTYVDVRREPVGLAIDGEFLYWVDRGEFVGPRDEPRFVEDGAIWRMRLEGSAPEKVADGLGFPMGMAVSEGTVLVADHHAEGEGLWAYPTKGGDRRHLWSGGRIKHLRDDVFVTDDRLDDLWRGLDQPREILPDVGYVDALTREGERIAVGGLVDGNSFNGIVTVLRGDAVERRLSLPRHWVKGVAFVGDDLLVAAGSSVLRVGKPGEPAVVERTTIDAIEQLTVYEGIVFYVATRAGPRFSLRAAAPGQAAVEIASGDGAAWRFVIDDTTVYFVESAPVRDPWTKVATPYRIGRVAWRTCMGG